MFGYRMGNVEWHAGTMAGNLYRSREGKNEEVGHELSELLQIKCGLLLKDISLKHLKKFSTHRLLNFEL